MTQPTQPIVFVSYSHKDETEKEALLTQLGVLQKAGHVKTWSDDRIGAGGDWQAEIAQAIEQARVAVLLITANFLTSAFILEQEVPKLLKRRQDEGMAIVPVIARACAWQVVPWLVKLNLRPNNGRPVWGDGGRHVDEDLAAIVSEIADILARPPAVTAAPPPPPAGPSSKGGSPTGKVDGLTKWWKKRGYKSNPFNLYNAADVSQGSMSRLFPLWHIDPAMPAGSQGLGDTPTLDRVMSLDTGEMVLIYAPGGGGKTFYRRWAIQQIAELESNARYALEIADLAASIPDLKHITARDLALVIRECLAEPGSPQAPSSTTQGVMHILRQCDDLIRPLGRVYGFIDGVESLFHEQPSNARHNARVLKALVEFCGVTANRGEGNPLALRMFLPERLREPIQKELGAGHLQHVRECAISWSVEHCQAIVERRLDSCWEPGPNTGTAHLGRLLTPDAIDEFRRWLHGRRSLSPRYAIRLLYQLGDYAYSHGVTTDVIGHQTWHAFLKSDDFAGISGLDDPYPFGLPRFSWLNGLGWSSLRKVFGR